MYVVIVGAGRVGTAIARWLLEAEQEVAVIDRDRRRCAAMEEELGSVAVVGEATESSVLRKAGASRADLLVVTGRQDDENLVVCQLGKHMFDIRNVMTTVNISEHVELFQRLGIDLPIDITMILVDVLEGRMGTMLAEQIGGR